MSKRQRRNVSCDEYNEGFPRWIPLSDFLSVVCDGGEENGEILCKDRTRSLRGFNAGSLTEDPKSKGNLPTIAGFSFEPYSKPATVVLKTQHMHLVIVCKSNVAMDSHSRFRVGLFSKHISNKSILYLLPKLPCV